MKPSVMPGTMIMTHGTLAYHTIPYDPLEHVAGYFTTIQD